MILDKIILKYGARYTIKCDYCGEIFQRAASLIKDTQIKHFCSESCSGKVTTEETRKKLSKANGGVNNPNYGNHWSEEIKEKIRKVHVGLHPSIETREKMSVSGKKKIFTEEHKRKLREQNIARMGQHLSEETRLRISLALKGKFTGENNPFYGKSHSEETRIKLSEQHQGMKYTDETNFKKGHKGSSHSNWRGGVTPEHEIIRHGLEYKNWQIAVFIRDNYTCQKCGAKNGNGKHIDFNAHHIKFFSKYPELRFDVDNGITLCVPCHETNGLHKGAWHKELLIA